MAAPTEQLPAVSARAGSQPGAWAVLGHRLFRALWIANVASGIGSTMHDTAAVWTMTTLTSSVTLVTLMQTMSSLPLFLLALPAGALADIVDRRKVILVAQSAAFVVAAALVGLTWLGALTAPVLLASTFALGITVAFTTPTWQAMIAEIVDKPDLSGAITLGSVGVNIARAIGPLVGGLLLALAGPAVVFLLNAISFLGIIIVLMRWRRERPADNAHAERMLGAMVTALRFTRHSPAIHGVLVRTAAFALFGIAPMALLPLVVRLRDLAAADFGIWMGAYGVGGIVAAIVVLPRLRTAFTSDRILGGATLVFAGMTAALTVAEGRWLTATILFVLGAAWLISLSTLAVAGQSAYPNWVRARSSALALIVLQGALALGALVWGLIAARLDVMTALRVAAAGSLVSLVLGWRFSIGGAQRMDLTPSDHWAGHTIAMEPDDDAGPVLVTLEYEVSPEREQAFRVAMAALREVRLRDGAFRWTLVQSLETPGRFRESFHIGSWGEHLRQHARATAEDRRIEEAVTALHRGSTPPQAAHFLVQDVGVQRKRVLRGEALS